MSSSIVPQESPATQEAEVWLTPEGAPYCHTINLFGKIMPARIVHHKPTQAERANRQTFRSLRAAQKDGAA